MSRYEYKITRHSSDAISDFVYMCDGKGECSLEKIATDQSGKIETILNQEGTKGWELVQIVFGRDGLLVFWKKIIID